MQRSQRYAKVSVKRYITNVLDDTLSVIDTRTNSVTATIAIAAGNDAVTSGCRKVYAAKVNPNGVSVVDTATSW